jgi:uncharacterized membrane protein YkvA (DUF1232 family)
VDEATDGATIALMTWLLAALGVLVCIYLTLIVGLVVTGRRHHVRAVAGFIPDCLTLFRRLIADERVPRHSKLLLGACVGYLALPIDLVPDFVPVAGQLDDAIVVALALRTVLRAAGPQLLVEHWPGPPSSLNALTRAVFGRDGAQS